MGSEKMRTFEFGGRKRGVRLDDGTWQALDWLADQRGVKWQALAQEWAGQATDGSIAPGENLTGIIRSAVMNSLLAATILEERADTLQNTGAIWQSLGMCDEEGIRRAIHEAQAIDGEQDFVGFKLAAGTNEFGFVTYYIENGIKDGINVAISTPFTASEWAERMGETQ